MFFVPRLNPEGVKWTSEYVDIMKDVVPMLAHLASLPDGSFNIQFYFSAIWMLAPLLGFSAVFLATFNSEVQKTKKIRLASSFTEFLKGFIAFSFGLGVLIFWPINPNQISWRDEGLVGSEVGVCFFGLMIVWTTTLLGVYVHHFFERLKYSIDSKS